MKEIINDIKSEGFSAKEMVVYGFIVPVVMVMAVIVGGAMC